MAEEPKITPATVEPMELRRIGIQHAVVLAPREAQVINVEKYRLNLAQIDRRLAAIEEEKQKLTELREDQALIVATFDAAPIDRIEGDPDVPVPPEPEPAPVEPAEVVPPVRRSRGG